MSNPKYPLTADEYQDFVKTTAIFPDDAGLVYTTLGMMGEAGEYSEKIKKMVRRGKTTKNKALLDDLTFEQRADLINELGDVVWYVTAALNQLDSTLQECIEMNVEKLKSRQQRGKLEGSGDNR